MTERRRGDTAVPVGGGGGRRTQQPPSTSAAAAAAAAAASAAFTSPEEVSIPAPGKPGFFIVFGKVWPFASVLNVLSTVYTDLVFDVQQAYTDKDTGKRIPPAFVARNVVADASCLTGLSLHPDSLGPGHWYCHRTVTICVPLGPLNKHIGSVPQQSQCILWTNSDDPVQLYVAHRQNDQQAWNGILSMRLRDMSSVPESSYYREVPPVLSTLMHARVAASFLTECFQAPRKTDSSMLQVTVVVVPEHTEAGGGGGTGLVVRPTTLAFLAASAMCSLTYTVAHGQECLATSDFKATVVIPDGGGGSVPAAAAAAAAAADTPALPQPIVARYPLAILGLVTKSGVQIGSVVDVLLLQYPGVPEPHLGICYTVGEGGLAKEPLGSLDIIVSPESIIHEDTAAELADIGNRFARMISRQGFVADGGGGDSGRAVGGGGGGGGRGRGESVPTSVHLRPADAVTAVRHAAKRRKRNAMIVTSDDDADMDGSGGTDHDNGDVPAAQAQDDGDDETAAAAAAAVVSPE